MTLLMVESFGHYTEPNGFGNQVARKWTTAESGFGVYNTSGSNTPRIASTAGGVAIPTGSGKAFRFPPETWADFRDPQRLIKGIPIGARYTVGFRLRFATVTDSQLFFMFGAFNWRLASDAVNHNGEMVSLGVTQGGELFVRDNGGGNPTIFNTGLFLSTDNWNYVEIQSSLNSADSQTLVRLNGQEAGPFACDSRHDLSGTNWFIGFWAPFSQEYWIGDFYLANTNGAINNDFLGDLLIVPRLPTNDVEVEFTPLSGADNFEMVNDAFGTGPDEDTTQNSSNVIDAFDLFGMTGTGFLSGYSVIGIQAMARARKLDSGIAILKHLIRTAADHEGADEHFVSNAYQNMYTVFETNPSTGLPFTLGVANTMALGYKIAAS